MCKEKETYDLILRLYEAKKYKETIIYADKFLNIEKRINKWDYKVKFIKAKSLKYLGMFDDSAQIFIELAKTRTEDSLYILELFYIYYFQNKYEDAYELLKELYFIKDKYIKNHSLAIAELVIKKHLGYSLNYKKGDRSEYVKSQIVNYSEEEAINHVINHTHDEESRNGHSRFNEGLNIKYLFECVKKALVNNHKIIKNDILEVHYFSVFGIGYDENTVCNYIKVVVVPNTSDIIALYPYSKIDSIDVEVLECDNEKLFKGRNKEKQISRIDRFNKRFNLK